MPEYRELLDGYHRFRRNDYRRHRARWGDLAKEQHPPVMIIACCDSRVDPATVFDLEPGQAFVLRNVANLVPPFETGAGLAGVRAAIEFGVIGLEVRHVVVMGHASCGGIKAALEGGDQGTPGHSHLDDWIRLIDAPRDAVLGDASIVDKQLALEQAAVRHSLANLRGFPYVAERVATGSLRLHGCHFAIGEGRLLVLDDQSGEFVSD